MTSKIDRRTFSKLLALSAGPLAVAAAPAPKLHIGYTCITWGAFPRADPKATVGAALKDIAAEGFWSYETFPDLLGTFDESQFGVPLRSGYISVNVTDAAQRKSELERVIRLSKVVQKYNGTFVVLSCNGVKRDTYKFQDHRADIVAGLNEYASAVTDLGLGTGLHQHTGTAVESRDEVYAVMEAVDTKRMKFAPDVGQLQKGGADPVRIVKDFLPIVKHMHLKDYKGWENYVGYCPLGMGMVDIKGVLDLVESGGQDPDVMVELDPSANAPMSPLETVKVTKAYLQKLGYQFRT